MEGRIGEPRTIKVKHFSLARVIADYLKRIPNAAGSSLVKKDGRMFVKVEVKEVEAERT